MGTIKPVSASECLHEKEFWEKNKKLNRPLSPHLTIYKPQLTSMLSITHRVTGCVQSGLLTVAAAGVLIMPGNFPSLLAEIQNLHLGGGILYSLKFLLSVPITYHFCYGFKIADLYKSGWFVCAITVATALLLAAL